MNHLQNLIRKKEYHWGRYICVDLHLEKINKREIKTNHENNITYTHFEIYKIA